MINLTQHAATTAQREAGVVDLSGAAHAELRGLITFDELPTTELVEARAGAVARLVCREAAWEETYLDADDRAEQGLAPNPDPTPQYGRDGVPVTPRGATAMIGGAPFFMAALERALIRRGVRPLYAFSRRESVEKTGPDGAVTKTQVFRHLGFVGVA